MNSAEIVAYLEAMGCTRVRVGLRNVTATCPRGDKHKDGADTTPSFSVGIRPQGRSPFLCWGCKTKGQDLRLLVWQVGLSREEMARLAEISDLARAEGLVNLEREIAALGEARFDKGKRKKLVTDYSTWRVDRRRFLDPYLKTISGYLLRRGLDKETIRTWEIGYDQKRRQVVFPVFIQDGRLIGVTKRIIEPCCHRCRMEDPKRPGICPDCGVFLPPRWQHTTGMPRNLHLFGETMIRPEWGNVHVVEGTIDVIALWQEKLNAVAPLGTAFSRDQADLLMKLLPPGALPIGLFDGDEAGRQAAEEFARIMKRRTSFGVTTFPEGCDPGDAMHPKKPFTLEEMHSVINGVEIQLKANVSAAP